MKTKVFNGEIITGGQNLGRGTVLMEDGIITGMEKGDVEAPGYEGYDAGGGYIMPGFIEVHSHGALQYDFLDCTLEALRGIARAHASHGTTLLFPTTEASSNEEIFRFFEVYEKVKDSTGGAAFGGIHLEGPYFSREYIGAQDPRFIKYPDPADYMPILEACPYIRRMSVAPELPGALELGRVLANRGIVASVAHTAATFDQVVEASKNGYTMFTHFYNAMKGITKQGTHRTGGCIEAGYMLDDMTVEVICDGIHVPKELLQLIVKVKGPGKVTLCTDSVRGAGLPEGSVCRLGSPEHGLMIVINEGVAKLQDDLSRLAGSVATTDRLVRTMHFLADQPLPLAVRMITENPACVMGVDSHKGKISRGYDADLVVCDREVRCKATFISGRRVFPE